MTNYKEVLKRIKIESKKFLDIEKESGLEEFRKSVFVDIFCKELGYTYPAEMKWVDQQACIINNRLKIMITLDEVDEKSIVNRLFTDLIGGEVKTDLVEWGIVICPRGLWLFNNKIGRGSSGFRTKKTVLEITYGKNTDQDYFEFFSFDNILGGEPNVNYFKDIAEYRNCYYKGSEKSWQAYSSALKRFLKYCVTIDLKYFKNQTDSIYDKIELPDFYSYIEEKTKAGKENTLRSAFFYIKDFMCHMSDKGVFHISTKELQERFAKNLKQSERQDVIDPSKLKNAIQYLEKGKNRERDVAMFLMELSFGLERRKLRLLKWEEDIRCKEDGSVGEIFRQEGKERPMPKKLIKALQRLRDLKIEGDFVFYRTKDNGKEPIREDAINDVFSKLAKIDSKDEYYKLLTPANIRSSLVRYMLAKGTSLERIIFLMNIEICNLGNYILLEDIDHIMEQRMKDQVREEHPMEKLLESLS